MLLKKLPRKNEGAPPVDVTDDVALHYYRLQKQAEGDILLAAEGTQELYGPAETGTGKADEDKHRMSKWRQLEPDTIRQVSVSPRFGVPQGASSQTSRSPPLCCLRFRFLLHR